MPEHYPVFGEFFQFMEAVLSTVVCNEILMDLHDVSMLLWKNGGVRRRVAIVGTEAIRDYCKGAIKSRFAALLTKNCLNEENREKVSLLVNQFF